MRLPIILASLLLACVLPAVDALLEDLPATAVRSEAETLLATGKAAVERYRSDQVANAGAIVDAAVSFELAHRAAAGSTDLALVNDIQSSQYWCRKQMDLAALQQYNARLAALPKPPVAKTAAKPVKPAKAAPPTPAIRPVQPEALALWVRGLQAGVRAAIAAGRPPQFELSALRAQATIRALRDDGGMDLEISGSGAMAYPWKLIGVRDQAAIAVALDRGDDPALHAQAAFFQLLAGDEAAGRMNLMRSGAWAAEVERSFVQVASAR